MKRLIQDSNKYAFPTDIDNNSIVVTWLYNQLCLLVHDGESSFWLSLATGKRVGDWYCGKLDAVRSTDSVEIFVLDSMEELKILSWR